MNHFVRLMLTIGLLSSAAEAHHSVSAVYNADRKSTIVGVVDEFSFKNPHVIVYIDVTNEDGSVTQWLSEGRAATNMRRQGWSNDSVQSGQTVRVSGSATHDGSAMVNMDYLEILDASTMQVTHRLGNVAFYQGNAYQPEKAESLPLTLADGKPNFSSVWSNRPMRVAAPGQFKTVVLNEVGQALQDSFVVATDSQVYCDPVGAVRQVVTPHPIKFIQMSDRVVIEYEEFGGRREIYFDGRNAKGFNTHYGDSIARYEGDRLIIETTNLLANQATNLGQVLSDKTSILETYRRADSEENGATLHLSMIVSDPIHLAEDIVYEVGFVDQGAYEFLENDCQPPARERVRVHQSMNFFVASDSLDGNISDLAAASTQCKTLATNVNQGHKNWVGVGYGAAEGSDLANILGDKVWYNAKGEVLAESTHSLFSTTSNITNSTAVTERGQTLDADGESNVGEVERVHSLLYCLESSETINN